MPTVTAPPQSPSIAKPDFHKAIAFRIHNHWLALPPATVLRVIHKTALTQGMGSTQLVYLGNQPLQVLDLRPMLAALGSSSADASSTAGRFFVIAASGKTLSAIAVDQPPILAELPVASTHAVPPAQYKAMGGIASHVVIVPQLGMVFLLNLSSI